MIPKKLTAFILSLLMMHTFVCAAFADDTVTDGDTDNSTATYYFLAPEDWYMPEYGAENEDIGCYWWSPEECAAWPGVKMESAPEIGQGVFKIDNVPKSTTTIIFNDFVKHDTNEEKLYSLLWQTSNLSTEGYASGECEYDPGLETDSFDGWIYVFDRLNVETFSEYVSRHGAWFTLDGYKNNEKYYGSYNLDQIKNGCTYYFLAPDDWFKTDKGAVNEDIGAYTFSGDIYYDSFAPENMKKLTPAPEVGENVFKLENVPFTVDKIAFCDYTDTGYHKNDDGSITRCRAHVISLRGYTPMNYGASATAPYDHNFTCSNFDNMIFVLNRRSSSFPSWNDDMSAFDGAWFTFDNYKNYVDYYGTYGFADAPKPDTYTYYFLAPDDWFKTDKGAANAMIGMCSKTESESGGNTMTPAPEIGRNVFKIEGVSPTFSHFRFNDCNDYEYWSDNIYVDEDKKILKNEYDRDAAPDNKSTTPIDVWGYKDGSCPYDKSVVTDNFDGWIYVLDGTKDLLGYSTGAWFTLDDYKNYAAYYGTYGFDDGQFTETYDDPHKNEIFTMYFCAPSSWLNDSKDNVGCYIYDESSGYLNGNWPGKRIEKAPEIGENVYKLTGYTSRKIGIIFSNLGEKGEKRTYCSKGVVSVPDDSGRRQEDGMVFVLDLKDTETCEVEDSDGDTTMEYQTSGKWFTVDDYKSDENFYGTYPVKPAEGTIYGDMDGDGEVTSSDALIALRISVGLEEYSGALLMIGDVNEDGVIDSTDAFMIQRFSVGITADNTKAGTAA